MTTGARNLAHQIHTTKRTRKRSKFGKVLGFALLVVLAFTYPWVLLLIILFVEGRSEGRC